MQRSAEAAASDPDVRPMRTALAVLVAATIARLFMGAMLPLFDDESYYWEWSRRLAAGYYDHPPAIAVLIRAGTALLGDTVLGVRLFPILAGSFAALGALATAHRLAGPRAAADAAVLFAVMPLAAAGLVLATPDAPFLAAASWMLYGVVRALEAPPGSRDTVRWWLVAGVALGLGLQSKYTAALVPVGVLLAVVLHPALRRRLLEPGPWLAVGAALAVSAPMVLWNARHDWISFAFQLEHGLGTPRGTIGDALARVAEFLGGQAALASPVLFVLMGIGVWQTVARRSPPLRFVLGVVSIVPLALFTYSATRRPVEANWPAVIYLSAGVLVVTMPTAAGVRRAFRAGVGLAALMSAVVYAHALVPFVPLRADRDPIAEAFGWAQVMEAAREAAPSPICPRDGATTSFAANRYQDAAQLAFQLAASDRTACANVYALNVRSRSNQYDLWPHMASSLRPGDHLLLVLSDTPRDSSVVAELRRRFRSVRADRVVPLERRGTEHGRRRVWVLEGWLGPE